MKQFKFIILLCAAIMILTGCSAFSKKPLSYTDTAFDTVVSVQIYDAVDQSVLQKCKTICQDYEAMFSRTIETSEISKINAAGGAPVTVSAETVKLIKKGIYYGELSDGALDITIGSVSRLWDFKTETPAVPASESISEALTHVDYRKINITDNTVTLEDPQAAIDLGGIAKGYIADRLKNYLESQGVRHALINLGGNVLAIGGKPDGSAFHIGIPKPFDKENTILTSVNVKDQSVVTSGTYQRYFETDGTRYHHILDPATGYPSNQGLNSVTILTDSSLTADALSTTCFVLGPEKGMKLINQLDNVDAVFVNDKNEISYSRNFQK